MYFIQHCFICRPKDFTVSEDAEIEPSIIVPVALAVRCSNHLHTVDFIHMLKLILFNTETEWLFIDILTILFQCWL
jgi:hypothetical protein